jgi:hypothetical protein
MYLPKTERSKEIKRVGKLGKKQTSAIANRKIDNPRIIPNLRPLTSDIGEIKGIPMPTKFLEETAKDNAEISIPSALEITPRKGYAMRWAVFNIPRTKVIRANSFNIFIIYIRLSRSADLLFGLESVEPKQ